MMVEWFYLDEVILWIGVVDEGFEGDVVVNIWIFYLLIYVMLGFLVLNFFEGFK